MSISIEIMTYTTNDAASITGMPSEQQSNLRRHGYIGKPGKKDKTRNQYSAHDVAEIFVMQKLSEQGVPPSTGKRIAERAAPAMVTHALRSPDAVSGRELLDAGASLVELRSEDDHRFLVAYGQNEFAFCDDLSEFFLSRSVPGDVIPTSIVVDLTSFAARLASHYFMYYPLAKVARKG